MRPFKLVTSMSLPFAGFLAACSPDPRMTGDEPPPPSARCLDPGAVTPPAVPAALEPPAGTSLAFGLHAEGTQIYVCRATGTGAGAGGPLAWALKAPDAKLYDNSCKQVGTHFGGPTWQSSLDGSAVVGAKVADAPAAGTIPWLLLKAQTNNGTGIFSRISAVQRVATAGGVMPTTGCDAGSEGKEQPVPYSADYYFYQPAP
jgi:hypothetical protein